MERKFTGKRVVVYARVSTQRQANNDLSVPDQIAFAERWIAEQVWFRLEPVLRDAGQRGFRVLPKRWIVERTFAWLTQCRRLSKDYEVLPASSVAMIYIAMTRLMVRRLAHG